jgi:hypothetical protein
MSRQVVLDQQIDKLKAELLSLSKEWIASKLGKTQTSVSLKRQLGILFQLDYLTDQIIMIMRSAQLAATADCPTCKSSSTRKLTVGRKLTYDETGYYPADKDKKVWVADAASPSGCTDCKQILYVGATGIRCGACKYFGLSKDSDQREKGLGTCAIVEGTIHSQACCNNFIRIGVDGKPKLNYASGAHCAFILDW